MIEFYFYFIAVLGVLFIALICLNHFSKSQESAEIVDQTTVIIPFRDEALNLGKLLESLKCQTKLPAHIIFVNDHSSDSSVDLVNEYLKSNDDASLINLPKNQFGKKKAIRFGLNNVETEYVLTIDADTWFNKDFFEKLRIQANTDMQIRPVVMKATSCIGHFASLEHSFFNALNKLIAPIYVLTASGANLLFKKATFEELDDIKTHQHIASGDDHYLLRSFQSGSANISLSSSKEAVVYTESANSISAYFKQRIRWLSKTKLKTTFPELLIGLFITMYLIGGFVALVYLLLIGRFDLFLMLFAGRLIIDSLVFLNYAFQIKQLSYYWLKPIFQLIYPILFISALIASLLFKPKWKGRKVE
ncbi:MAG: glycosyltransferase [Brumimicrobium sp.]